MTTYHSFSPKAAQSRIRATQKAAVRRAAAHEESALWQQLVDEEIAQARATSEAHRAAVLARQASRPQKCKAAIDPRRTKILILLRSLTGTLESELKHQTAEVDFILNDLSDMRQHPEILEGAISDLAVWRHRGLLLYGDRWGQYRRLSPRAPKYQERWQEFESLLTDDAVDPVQTDAEVVQTWSYFVALKAHCNKTMRRYIRVILRRQPSDIRTMVLKNLQMIRRS
jgi:hypothetical protein